MPLGAKLSKVGRACVKLVASARKALQLMDNLDLVRRDLLYLASNRVTTRAEGQAKLFPKRPLEKVFPFPLSKESRRCFP